MRFRTAHRKMNRSREKNWSGSGEVKPGRRSTVRSTRKALKRAGCTCDPDLSIFSDAELQVIADNHRWIGLHLPWCRLG